MGLSLSCAAHAAVITGEHALGGALFDRLTDSDPHRAMFLRVPGPRYRLEQWFERCDGDGEDDDEMRSGDASAGKSP